MTSARFARRSNTEMRCRMAEIESHAVFAQSCNERSRETLFQVGAWVPRKGLRRRELEPAPPFQFDNFGSGAMRATVRRILHRSSPVSIMTVLLSDELKLSSVFEMIQSARSWAISSGLSPGEYRRKHSRCLRP